MRILWSLSLDMMVARRVLKGRLGVSIKLAEQIDVDAQLREVEGLR